MVDHSDRTMATLPELDRYRLNEVHLTDREVGCGSYAIVLELDYMGVKCAGKKIHEVLLKKSGEMNHVVRRFEQECRILSQVRHPNVVQFLGVFFQQGLRVPILVMEYLPLNLTSFIEKYNNVPEEIAYSILHDVALGLRYFHSQSPPIIHRDLSSNNILLATNMQAKISDLGVARMLELTPLQVSQMTQVPGTPAYMPPEVMVAKPKYNTRVDVFSYGILLIHMLSGEWPIPQVGQIRTEGDKMIPVSEAERRQEFLAKIGYNHPLMGLILQCIDNDPHKRKPADQIVKQLSEMVAQHPASYDNQLEMLQDIATKEAEKAALQEAGTQYTQEIQQLKRQMSTAKDETDSRLKQKADEIDQLKRMHAIELEQLKLTVKNLNSQLAFLSAEKTAALQETIIAKNDHQKLISEIERYKEIVSTQTESFELSVKKIQEEYALLLAEAEEKLYNEKQRSDERLTEERKEHEALVVEQRKRFNKLTDEKVKLLAEVASMNSRLESLMSLVASLEGKVATRDSALESSAREITEKKKAAQEKEAVISGINEQLTKARLCCSLTDKQQVSGVCVCVCVCV